MKWFYAKPKPTDFEKEGKPKKVEKSTAANRFWKLKGGGGGAAKTRHRDQITLNLQNNLPGVGDMIDH
jgi:hypothetical protein